MALSPSNTVETFSSVQHLTLLTHDEVDEDEANSLKDLNFYLDYVLEKQPALPAILHSNRETYDKVKKVVVKLSLYMTQHSKRFAQVFQPLHEENAEGLQRCVRQQHADEFTARFFLKRPNLPGTFEVMTGRKKNVPAGQGLIRLSSELATEERMLVRKEWLPCLDQHNHLSISKLHSWLDSDIEKVLRKMRVEHKEMKGVKLDKGSDTSLRLLMEMEQDDSTRGTDSKDDSSHEAVVTISLLPAIEGKGWPTDVPLKHPLPCSRPWSVLGSMWVNDAKSAIKDGQALWFLEEGNYAISTGGPNWPIWDLSFVPLEDIWEERLFGLETMVHLHSALSVLELIKGNSTLQWQLLGSDIMRHIVFNWVKNSADKNRTLADWLIVLLQSICEIITSEGVCAFFCPSCSLVKDNQLRDLLKFKAGVELFVAELKSDPSVIVKYIFPENALVL